MNIGDLFYGLRADGALLQRDVAKEGDKAGKVLAEHTSQAFSESIKRGFGFGVGIGLFNALQNSISGVAGGIEGLIATSLSKAGEVERFTTQFEVLLGSVDAADKRIRELVQFAATTPFELPQVIEASRTLQVFTKGALATGDGLRMVGDIAAGTGQPIQEVSVWIGRLYDAMQSGRPFGEATQRLQEMGALSGENRALIERLAAAVKDGTMTMSEGWAAASATFGQFTGLMDKQSQTLEGQFSNLADATGQAFAAVGDALMPIAKEVIPQLIALVKGLGETIANFIRQHATELRDMILSLTQAAFGFVAGLFAMTDALGGPMAASIKTVGAAGAKAAMSFDEWRTATGNMPAALDKTKAAAKGATTAIDRQIESTQKAIDTDKRRDDASETIFQRTMRRLSDEYGAQLDALDLAERQIAIADRQRDLNEQLNQAQMDLAGAKGGTDAQAVSDAMAKVADIQAQQAENERRLTVDAQRERLQATQDYIENVAKIEADSEDKKALANTLAKRRDKLTSALAVATAAKDADAIADITAKLEAVKTAEERTAAAIRSKDKADELTGLKTQLEAQRKAMSASGASQVADDKKKLADLKSQYDAYLKEQRGLTLEHVGLIEAQFAGDPKAGTGLGGAITKAFKDGQKAGEDFRAFITDDLVPALQSVLDVISTMGGVIGEIVKGLGKIQEVRDALADAAGDIPGAALRNSPVGPALGGAQTLRDWLASLISGSPPTDEPRGERDRQGSTRKPPMRATGGPVMRGQPYLVGEEQPEVIVPRENSTVVPSLGAFLRGEPEPGSTDGGAGGAQTLRDWLSRLTGPKPADERPGATVPAVPQRFVPSELGTPIPSLGAMSGYMGGGDQTIEVPVYLDGAEITRVVARRLANQLNS